MNQLSKLCTKIAPCSYDIQLSTTGSRFLHNNAPTEESCVANLRGPFYQYVLFSVSAVLCTNIRARSMAQLSTALSDAVLALSAFNACFR